MSLGVFSRLLTTFHILVEIQTFSHQSLKLSDFFDLLCKLITPVYI